MTGLFLFLFLRLLIINDASLAEVDSCLFAVHFSERKTRKKIKRVDDISNNRVLVTAHNNRFHIVLFKQPVSRVIRANEGQHPAFLRLDFPDPSSRSEDSLLHRFRLTGVQNGEESFDHDIFRGRICTHFDTNLIGLW